MTGYLQPLSAKTTNFFCSPVRGKELDAAMMSRPKFLALDFTLQKGLPFEGHSLSIPSWDSSGIGLNLNNISGLDSVEASLLRFHTER